MILIAHRGLFKGPSKELENHPDQIIEAWEQGYHCEIDLRVIGKEFWLGHDDAQYQVDVDFLYAGPSWIHAKNIEALHYLTFTELDYFWHQEDDFTLTSSNYIWTYPGKPLTDRSIMVMPEWNNPELKDFTVPDCYGICSDFVEKIRGLIPNAQN
jgi:hypothetical protein